MHRRLAMRCLLKLAIIVLIIVFVQSCASYEIKRTVDENNNVFYSSEQPELRIKINDALKHWGDINDLPGAPGDSFRDPNGRKDVFNFRNIENSRFLFISITNLTDPRRSFFRDISGIDNLLEKGSDDLKDGTYTYIIKADMFENATFLFKVSKRITGSHDNISILITYGEQVNGFWGSLASLTEEQRNRLQEFKVNWKNAFEIQ